MVKLFTLNSGADLLLSMKSENNDEVTNINFASNGQATYVIPSEDEINEQNRTVFESEIYSRIDNAIELSKGNVQPDNAVPTAVLKPLHPFIQELVKKISEGYE